MKHIQELLKNLSRIHWFQHALSWWVGVRSIADCISGCKKAVNIGQKLAEKESLGLKCTQLIRHMANIGTV